MLVPKRTLVFTVCVLLFFSFSLAFCRLYLNMAESHPHKNFSLVSLRTLLFDTFLPHCYLTNFSNRTALNWLVHLGYYKGRSPLTNGLFGKLILVCCLLPGYFCLTHLIVFVMVRVYKLSGPGKPI